MPQPDALGRLLAVAGAMALLTVAAAHLAGTLAVLALLTGYVVIVTRD